MKTYPDDEEPENGFNDREDADRWTEQQAELELIQMEES